MVSFHVLLWQLGYSLSCRNDTCPDKPSLHMEGLLTIISYPRPYYTNFLMGNPKSPDLSLFTILIIMFHNLQVCALIRLGEHGQIARSRDSSWVSGYPCAERSILPVSDWEGDPSPRRASSQICLMVDSNGRPNLDT